MVIAAAGGVGQDERLLVGSRLASSLAHAHGVKDVAALAVRQLHDSFDYYLAVVQRLDPDGSLRVVAAAGPLAERADDFLAVEQPVEIGVNGRVARTGEAAMVNDTRLDSDYLARNPRTDPGSELSLPIRVAGSVWGVMNLEQVERDAFAGEDLLLAHIVAGQIGSAIYRCQLVDELEGAFLTTLGVLADAVELQDAYTADHANEVADLAVAVGERMGIGGPELDRLRYGALLHDVGKIGVPVSCSARRVRSPRRSARKWTPTPRSAPACWSAFHSSPRSPRWSAQPTSALTAAATRTACAARKSPAAR
jgi:hypothetical protein